MRRVAAAAGRMALAGWVLAAGQVVRQRERETASVLDAPHLLARARLQERQIQLPLLLLEQPVQQQRAPRVL